MSIKKQTLWSMLPLLSVTVINVVSVPAFYRFLGAEMYALWFYVLTFSGAFGFMDLGLGVAVGRYMGVALGNGDSQAVREYWGTGNAIALPLLLAMSAGFIAIGIAFGPKWFNVAPGNITTLRWSFIAGGIGLFFTYYSQFWLILSQVHLEFRFLALMRTAMGLFSVLPAIAFAWATHNPVVLMIWSAIAAALQLGAFIWHGLRTYRLGLSLHHANWSRAREMAGYTGKTFAALLIHSFLGSVDRLLIARLATPADFAHFNIVTNVGARIQGMSVAIMGPVSSNTSRSLGSSGHEGVAAVYNETFSFVFPWFLLASLWTALWHPVLLRVWLGEELGAEVAPLFTPIIAGYCLTAVTNISGAQLGSLNRIGTSLFFTVATGLLLVLGVYLGWKWAGVTGVAWGFLFSRFALLAQDLLLARLIGAGGWLSMDTWRHLAGQCTVGLLFSLTFLIVPQGSLWQLLPAAAHGVVVAGWLLRAPLKNIFRSLGASPEPSV